MSNEESKTVASEGENVSGNEDTAGLTATLWAGYSWCKEGTYNLIRII